MAQALPLTKLAGLLIKTLAKPLSKSIKHQVSRYATGQRVLIAIGQTTHNISSRMTIWAAGYRVRSITPLEQEQALKEGAEFVGESFLFIISGSWLLYEYQNAQEKSKEKEQAQRAQAKAERDELRTQLHAIDVRLVALENALQKQWGVSYQPPPEKTKVTIAAPLTPDDDDMDEKDKDNTKSSSSSKNETVGEKETDPSNKGWIRWIWPF